MRDPFRWSISLGRWGVPTVRLHVFFLVFAAATYFLCWQDVDSASGNLIGMATAALTVLLISVLVHEWSHWLVANRFGLAPNTMVIGPLGGVSPWPQPDASAGGLLSMLAGPLANLGICLLSLLALRAVAPHLQLVELLNPLKLVWSEPTTGLQGLQLTFWINWLLFLVNLLPAYPFDGGHILRSVLMVARPDWEERRLTEVVFWTAAGLSALMMAVALVLLKTEADPIFPTSLALLLLAVVLLVSARRDAEQATRAVIDDVYDTELEEPWPADSALGSRERRRAQVDRAVEEDEGRDDDEPWLSALELDDRQPVQKEVEAEEERQVDAILSRLHNQGLESLTPEERALLERVSARYRSRLGRRS